MPERWVVNASPLISLAKIGRLSLLTALAEEVVAPPASVAEVLRGADVASAALASAADIRRVSHVDVASSVALWGLGAGETEVLSFAARNPGYTALVDDNMARRCAKALNIPTRGTVGVVVLAKQRGVVESAAAIIGELQAAGLYLSAGIIHEALVLAGER